MVYNYYYKTHGGLSIGSGGFCGCLYFGFPTVITCDIEDV